MTIYYDRVVLVQNDYGKTLTLQLVDNEGNPINLTASGAKLLSLRRVGDTTNKISGQSCITLDASSGLVTYTLVSGDISSGGIYKAQLSYRTSGAEITGRGLEVVVEEDYLPR